MAKAPGTSLTGGATSTTRAKDSDRQEACKIGGGDECRTNAR